MQSTFPTRGCQQWLGWQTLLSPGQNTNTPALHSHCVTATQLSKTRAMYNKSKHWPYHQSSCSSWYNDLTGTSKGKIHFLRMTFHPVQAPPPHTVSMYQNSPTPKHTLHLLQEPPNTPWKVNILGINQLLTGESARQMNKLGMKECAMPMWK